MKTDGTTSLEEMARMLTQQQQRRQFDRAELDRHLQTLARTPRLDPKQAADWVVVRVGEPGTARWWGLAGRQRWLGLAPWFLAGIATLVALLALLLALQARSTAATAVQAATAVAATAAAAPALAPPPLETATPVILVVTATAVSTPAATPSPGTTSAPATTDPQVTTPVPATAMPGNQPNPTEQPPAANADSHLRTLATAAPLLAEPKPEAVSLLGQPLPAGTALQVLEGPQDNYLKVGVPVWLQANDASKSVSIGNMLALSEPQEVWLGEQPPAAQAAPPTPEDGATPQPKLSIPLAPAALNQLRKHEERDGYIRASLEGWVTANSLQP